MSGVDVLTFGETMVAFRSDAPYSAGGTLTTRLAGSEFNVAIGLARLGHRTSWAGRVGADPFGHLIMQQLKAEGVRTEHAVVDPVRPTGLMFVEQRTADVARVEYRRTGSAGSALTTAQLLPALADGPRMLHLTGITPALSTSARECTLTLAEAAASAGAQVTLDVNYRHRLWSRPEARDVLTQLIPYTRVVIASDDELELVAEGDEPEAVRRLMAAGVQLVAIKRGAAGATIHTRDDQSCDSAALAVTPVDPIGAGDAFTAGLLSGLIEGLTPAESLRRAVTTGAFVVSTKGDWEGAPNRAELALLEHVASGTVR